ncbi:SpaH/EbpB family LPXTG-anchored major pilin [Gardnerella vaginalis]|uniref:SpaH/EbpB family LPXTG-anchored major pilin n=1 Tax=Gardnerella vaginalis TaxID=2702 RepID=UPI0039F0BE60
MNKLTKKCVAAIASLAMAGTLCVAGAVTMASVAWGVPKPFVQPPAAKTPWGNKLPAGPYSITIVNCDAASGGDKGQSQCEDGHAPLTGSEFKLTPIKKIGKTDLTATDAFKKKETWAAIATTIDALNRGDEKAANIELDDTAVNIKTQPVGTDGTAKFTDVKLGFYKVEETKMPTGNYGANDTTVFYMTLPQIERKQKAEGSTEIVTKYEYNPVVKIKNKDLSSAITKVFSTEKGSNAVSVKDTFKYVISSEVNHPAGTLDADSIKDYAVFDDAPTEAFESITEAAVESVKVDGVTEALEKGDTKDYTVSVTSNTTQAKKTENGDDKGLEAGRTRILVKFTPTGLGKIATALNDAVAAKKKDEPKVHVTVSFKLKEEYKNGQAPKSGETDTTGKNEIKNKSGFFKSHPHNATKDPNPIIPDGGVKDVKLGFLQVNKYDNKTGNKLSGAEFKIFNSIDKAETCKAALLNLPADSATVPNECSDGASTNSGGTTVDGGGFSAAQKVVAGIPLYLIEVKAPTNYARPNSITTISVAEKGLTTVDVPNTKISDLGIETWFNLPATGAAGVILFALAGMGLIAASVFLYMRNRKEEEQAKA